MPIPARGFSWGRRMRLRLRCVNPVAADVSPLIIPAGEKFEPTHVGCYDEIDERPACPSGSLSGRAQTSRRRLAMTRQAWAKYQCQSRRADFQGDCGQFLLPMGIDGNNRNEQQSNEVSYRNNVGWDQQFSMCPFSINGRRLLTLFIEPLVFDITISPSIIRAKEFAARYSKNCDDVKIVALIRIHQAPHNLFLLVN